MRSAHVLACAWGTLVCASAFLACAASGDETTRVRQPESDGGESVIPDGGESVTPDGGAPEGDAEIEASAEESRCSDAGWCVTALPDPDLVLRDIWPIGVRAFAMLTRCLPLLFPLWAPVTLLASFTRRGDLTTRG